MAETIEELTVNYEEDGIQVVKEEDKEVLTKGAWTTIMFKFRNYDKKTEDYGPVKYTIRRYRKINGFYRQQSKFNISNDAQAKKIISTLSKWVDE